MAHVFGLNKIKDAMTSVWGYGDIIFSKEPNEINFNHNNIYPMAVVVQPESATPSIYDGWEDYSYTVYFCMLWKKTNRSAGPIEQKWDNIQRIANEWLDNLLQIYNNEDLILDPTTLNITRHKNFGNDKVLAIQFDFVLQGFRTCFNPQKFHPDSFNASNISQPGGKLSMYPANGTKSYEAKQECRGWWRFDGWKETILHQTVRYVKGLNDMGLWKRTENNQDVTHKLKSFGYDSEDKLKMSVLNSNDSAGNEIFFGEGTKQNKTPSATQQHPGYTIEKKGDMATNPEDMQFQALNGNEFSLGFVFELGRDDTADENAFIFNSDNGIIEANGTEYYGYGFAISAIAGGLLKFTFISAAGNLQSQNVDVTDLFGTDIYTKENRVVSMVVTYDGQRSVKIFVPNHNSARVSLVMPLDTTGLSGPNFQPWWGLFDNSVFCKANPTVQSMRNSCWRNNCYEFLVYNYDMSTYTDHETTVTQPKKINNYWKQKYNIELNNL